MPKIITTTLFDVTEDYSYVSVNRNSFALPAASDVLTPEDVRDYLEPFRILLLSMPGIKPDEHQLLFRGNHTISIIEFDTMENAQSAFDLLFGENSPVESSALKNLLASDKYRDTLKIRAVRRYVAE